MTNRMDVISYISIGALIGIMGKSLISMVMNFFYSQPVQQIVNMTLMVRDSMPPAVREAAELLLYVGGQALIFVGTLLANLWSALIAAKNTLPPAVWEGVKHGLIFVARSLRLVLHIVFQALVMLKNMVSIIHVALKGLYVSLRSFNDVFSFVWTIPENYIYPVTNWMFANPMPSYNWYVSLLIFCAVAIVAYKAKQYILRAYASKEETKKAD